MKQSPSSKFDFRALCLNGYWPGEIKSATVLSTYGQPVTSGAKEEEESFQYGLSKQKSCFGSTTLRPFFGQRASFELKTNTDQASCILLSVPKWSDLLWRELNLDCLYFPEWCPKSDTHYPSVDSEFGSTAWRDWITQGPVWKRAILQLHKKIITKNYN